MAALQETLKALHVKASSDQHPISGATACLALISGGELHLASIGDVGALLVEDRRIAFVGPTQNPEESSERLRIQRAGVLLPVFLSSSLQAHGSLTKGVFTTRS